MLIVRKDIILLTFNDVGLRGHAELIYGGLRIPQSVGSCDLHFIAHRPLQMFQNDVVFIPLNLLLQPLVFLIFLWKDRQELLDQRALKRLYFKFIFFGIMQIVVLSQFSKNAYVKLLI